MSDRSSADDRDVSSRQRSRRYDQDHQQRSSSDRNSKAFLGTDPRRRRESTDESRDPPRRRRSRDRESSRRERDYRHRSRSRSRSRSREQERSHRRRHARSRSPAAAAAAPPPSATKRRRRSRGSSPQSRSPPPARRSRAALPSQDEFFQGAKPPLLDAEGRPLPPPVEKQKPNFKPTGLLAKEANTVAGTTTVLKYHEPPEARKPAAREQWRLYVFKKKDLLDTVHLHHRSVWLFGRDEKVADLLLEHPSISKQHAVVQFRYITTTNEFGDKLSRVKPYLIDLDSANGTKLNGKKVGGSRYVELVDGDVVAFGDSEREYVLMLPPPEK